MSYIVDTHCHLNLPEFSVDQAEVIARAVNNQVGKMVIVGIDRLGWASIFDLVKKYKDNLCAAPGLHPLFVENHVEDDLTELENLISKHSAEYAAIGEIGLDYFEKGIDKVKQQHYFEAQLSIAQAYEMPIIMHVRKAHDEVIKTINSYHIASGIVHAYSGNIQQAYKYIDKNIKIGFGGSITYPRSTKLRELVKKIPLESIVLETDAPYMTVNQYQYQRNEPSYIQHVCESIAEIKQLSYEEVLNVSYKNSFACLNIINNQELSENNDSIDDTSMTK